MGTELLYLDDSYLYASKAKIINILPDVDGKTVVVLDRTVMYPQGGGQPSDIGTISSGSGNFDVESVRLNEFDVYHYGSSIVGILNIGDEVEVTVNNNRRILNSKYHTAGHLIDGAAENLGFNLVAGKGYQWPEGAYIEYIGEQSEEVINDLRSKLPGELDRLVAANLDIVAQIVAKEDLGKYCKRVPDYIPENKPCRIVKIGDLFAIPCGGTHVKNTAELGKVTIEKIKNKSGNLRVSYSVKD